MSDQHAPATTATMAAPLVSRFEKYRPKPIPTIRRYAAVNLGGGLLGVILTVGALVDDKPADPLVVLIGVLLILTGWGGVRTLTELRHVQARPAGQQPAASSQPAVPAPTRAAAATPAPTT